MKISWSLFPVLFLSVFTLSCEDEKKPQDPGLDLGALHISKEKPQPGDQLNLTYTTDESEEEDSVKVEGFYHYFVGPNAYPEDLEFTDSSGVWIARLALPDSATAVAFNISRNNIIDNNNKKGYVLPLYNTEGELLAESRASQALFYSNYGSRYEVKNDSALALLEEDLQENPELRNDWDQTYARMLFSKDPKRGKAYMQERIKERGRKANPEEKDLLTVHRFYEILKDNKSSDSLEILIFEKFPKSELVKQKYLTDLRKTADVTEKEKIFQEFTENFGPQESGFQKNYMLHMLSSSFAEKEDWKKFQEYSNRMTDKDMQASLYNNLAWNMAKKEENLEQAAQLSKKSLELVKEGEKPDYYTKKQHQQNLKYSQRMYQDTYAFILMKQGKLDEALAYQEKAVDEGDNSGFNERYVQLLLKANQPARAKEKAAEFIRQYSASPATKEAFKEAYIKTEGSENGLQEELANLEKAGKEKAIADISKRMLNEEAPAFNLKDLEGKEVSLASLEGKTVILDFWATWCGPCVNSFPGMKNAVEKYKEDPKVAFLFIDTFENTPTREKDVAGFIDQNNYPFHVLFDKTIGESNNFQTAEDYGISGIPTKVIIGPNGKIRFKEVGYSGNNEQMVEKLGMMIDLLNKNQTTSPDENAI